MKAHSNRGNSAAVKERQNPHHDNARLSGCGFTVLPSSRSYHTFSRFSCNIRVSPKHPLITVAAYPQSEIPERYYPTRNLNCRCCLLCIHYTARRDLRQDKRYIVPLEKGRCRLGRTLECCASYERIPELRARNMTPQERAYHRMYTRKQLRQLLARYYGDQQLKLDIRAVRLAPWELADIIAASKFK